MSLISLADDIWVRDDPMKLAGLFELGHRMTVIRWGEGQLLVHSPVRFSVDLATELARLGQVRYLIAPSTFHDLYLKQWLKAYPAATFLAAEGFARSHGAYHGLLPGDWPSELGEDVGMAKIEGMPSVNEVLLCHRPSRSLIVADFVFNLDRDCSFPTTALLKLSGVYRTVGPSKLYRSCIKDAALTRRSVDEILGWDFDRVVVSHGDVVETDGVERIRAAYAWL